MKKTKNNSTSTCLLTGDVGKMVKSHIIPKALTRNEIKGGSFIEERNMNGHIVYSKAFDSWHDSNIVTQKGEDILANLDNFAIKELREKGMVWSGKFGNFTEDSTFDIVKFNNPQKMRIYFLSLLWRASVSSHPVFKNINLDASKIAKLKALITGEIEDDFSFFPVSLHSLSLGEIHNYSAGFDIIENITFFRLYHDGLIIKFMDREIPSLIEREAKIKGKNINNDPSFFVDNNKSTYFIKIQFKGSKQEDELLEVRKRHELKKSYT